MDGAIADAATLFSFQQKDNLPTAKATFVCYFEINLFSIDLSSHHFFLFETEAQSTHDS